MNLYNLYLQAINVAGRQTVLQDLNVAPGTMKRWEEKEEVPQQYYFDLMRLSKQPIDYTQFSFRDKDQFFTDSSTAKAMVEKFYEIVGEYGIAIEDYVFIEPSAGDGSFLEFLPENTIALDIESSNPKIKIQDFFAWAPEPNKKYIVIGNPPFGLRGQQALKFINKALTCADFCAFILPPLFDSDGRGTPKKRIKGNLIYSGPCGNKYYYPNGQTTEVNTIFQIWTRLDLPSLVEETVKPKGFEIYSLSDGGTPGTTRNKDKIGKCDFYLPSTIFGADRMREYSSFEDLPQRRGYGIILKEKDYSHNIDWATVAFASTNGALNLRMSYIIKALNNEDVR